MPDIEIELNPADFVTIGTVGPKGKRVFYLQAGQGDQIVSLVIEKEQSWALSEAIKELIEDLDKRLGAVPILPGDRNMDLRDPIEPLFRVSQMGLGYDEEQDSVVLVAQELVLPEQDETEGDPLLTEAPDEIDGPQPGVVRIWCSRSQMRALSEHAISTVKSGRADPKQNGRLVYYWT